MEKYQYYNGLKFTRDEKTGYYLNATNRIRMHRYVWECINGPIPEGYEIHHIDHNKANNDISNLMLLTREEHKALHSAELTQDQRDWYRKNFAENARPAAAAWHRSEEGRAWHQEHAKNTLGKIEEQSYVCEFCGNPFQSRIANSRFCSNACKSAWRRSSGVDDVSGICEVCGNQMTYNRFHPKRTCSRRCTNILMHREKGHVIDEPVERVCVICGKSFATTARRETKTCSRSCAARLSHLKRNN